MADTLFIVIVFGGGMLVLLSKTEIGRAIADRIRGHVPASEPPPALLEEVDRLRQEMTELQERMEFAERLLTARSDAEKLGSP
ncbi:MAG TPA: hypothetical protein VMG41_11330 [Gemmatimonadales bacterium]|nr:hypothetical protein [Gemmatimonadales bacterium]